MPPHHHCLVLVCDSSFDPWTWNGANGGGEMKISQTNDAWGGRNDFNHRNWLNPGSACHRWCDVPRRVSNIFKGWPQLHPDGSFHNDQFLTFSAERKPALPWDCGAIGCTKVTCVQKADPFLSQRWAKKEDTLMWQGAETRDIHEVSAENFCMFWLSHQFISDWSWHFFVNFIKFSVVACDHGHKKCSLKFIWQRTNCPSKLSKCTTQKHCFTRCLLNAVYNHKK